MLKEKLVKNMTAEELRKTIQSGVANGMVLVSILVMFLLLIAYIGLRMTT